MGFRVTRMHIWLCDQNTEWYQTLYYLLDVFHPKFSKVKDKRKENFLLQVSVIIQKFKIQKSLF